MFARSLLGCARLTYRTIRLPKLCPATSEVIANRMRSTYGPACAEDEGPRCSPRRLAKSDCMIKKKEEKLNPRPPFQFKALLYNPECCEDPCPEVLPRFDDLYYTPRDKSKIKYERTWVECKSPNMKIKRDCTSGGIKPPPFIKRKFKKKCGLKRCEISENAWKLGLMNCKKSVLVKCPRLILPGCKAARHKPSCECKHKSPSGCKKPCTPYPSFSECDRPPLRQGKPVECFCLGGASNCEIVLYLQKLKRNAKKRG